MRHVTSTREGEGDNYKNNLGHGRGIWYNHLKIVASQNMMVIGVNDTIVISR